MVHHRRNVTAGQPFLTVDPNLLFLDKSVSLEENLPVAAINTAAELLERFLSGPLFPFRYCNLTTCTEFQAFQLSPV